MALKVSFEIFPMDAKPEVKKGGGFQGGESNRPLAIACWDVEIGARTLMKESGEPGDRRRYDAIKLVKKVDEHSVVLAKMLITNTPCRGVMSIYEPLPFNNVVHQHVTLAVEFGHKSGAIDSLNGFVSGIALKVPDVGEQAWG